MPLASDAILALARDFMRCRILLTGAELDLFTLLAPAPLSAGEVAQRISGDERAVRALLDALAALDLLTKRNERYRCEPDVAALLAANAPRSVLPMVLHDVSLWQRWHELTGIVRGDPAARTRAMTPHSDAGLRAFIGAMHVVAGDVSAEVVAAFDPSSARRLLDIGGGPATYTIACLRAAPRLRATLFDRPAVIAIARQRLAAEGLLDRVELVAGDFDADELPPGHDLALLSAIIHQNSSPQNRELYAKAWRALVPGGRLVIRDHVMSPDHTRPADGAVFAINLLVGTPGGGTYSFEEIRADLEAARFGRIRCIRENAGMNSLVEAFRPEP